MKFIYSYHWKKQKRYRTEITDDIIEMCINDSIKLKDRIWNDAYNAIAKISPSGRTLKVVYKEKGKDIKIITAYWLD